LRVLAKVENQMNLTKYALVDAFDALSACEDSESTWLCALKIANELGVDAINTGALDIESATMLWARSSMSQTWLEEYMRREYFKVDPLIELFTSKQSRRTIYCDRDSIANDTHGGNLELSTALNKAGYSLLHGSKFMVPQKPTGRIVTLCFQTLEREAFDKALSMWTTVSALIAGFSMDPTAKTDQDVFAFVKPELSARETEVLSLLATGMQTGRIAEKTGLAEITVSKHFRTARQKLRAAAREQALIIAMQHGLLKF
jgi:DNA-binding CsgD family transcriptional regulator